MIAVDWSGKHKREVKSIWLAEVRDGVLTSLENGRGRAAIIQHIIRISFGVPRISNDTIFRKRRCVVDGRLLSRVKLWSSCRAEVAGVRFFP